MVNNDNKITLFHFSDLHFGKNHIFNSDSPKPFTLAKSIIGDINKNEKIPRKQPIMIAVTGDFTEGVDDKTDGFIQSASFLNEFLETPIKGHEIEKKDIFIVPGNHDVELDKNTPENRLLLFSNFYKNFYGRPHEIVNVLHRNNVVILEINSCASLRNKDVQYSEDRENKKNEDTQRAHLYEEEIKKIKEQLDKLKKDLTDFENCIKIALLHHHVVLLPSLADKPIVDTIFENQQLLKVLGEYKFQLILHGHKHSPCLFPYDPNPLRNNRKSGVPHLIIAGGSCGHKDAPNTFCRIDMETEPNQIKIEIKTKELKKPHEYSLMNEWEWKEVSKHEIRIRYKNTPNEIGWETTMSCNYIPIELKECLKNCLLEDEEFYVEYYGIESYDKVTHDIYKISSLKSDYIEKTLERVKEDLQEIGGDGIIKEIISCYSELQSQDEIRDSVEKANSLIKIFLKKH